MELLRQGEDKESILDKTGMTVGVQDAVTGNVKLYQKWQ
jgi:ABC-type proline/glycine betaine transport system ATPase subunit